MHFRSQPLERRGITGVHVQRVGAATCGADLAGHALGVIERDVREHNQRASTCRAACEALADATTRASDYCDATAKYFH